MARPLYVARAPPLPVSGSADALAGARPPVPSVTAAASTTPAARSDPPNATTSRPSGSPARPATTSTCSVGDRGRSCEQGREAAGGGQVPAPGWGVVDAADPRDLAGGVERGDSCGVVDVQRGEVGGDAAREPSQAVTTKPQVNIDADLGSGGTPPGTRTPNPSVATCRRMPFMQVTDIHACRQMSPHVGSTRRRGAPTEHPGPVSRSPANVLCCRCGLVRRRFGLLARVASCSSGWGAPRRGTGRVGTCRTAVWQRT